MGRGETDPRGPVREVSASRGHRVRAMAAVALSALVHLVTGALMVGGTLLIVLGWETVVQPVLGFVVVCLAVQLLPRFEKVEGGVLLSRADAPQLFGLLDDIAQGTGTRVVDTVRLTDDFGIRAAPSGLRGRRLDIGLALWETLPPQQRVACLAHALGHFAADDVRFNLMVRTALPILTRSDAPSGDAAALREQTFSRPVVRRSADEMAEAAGRFRVDSALSRWASWIATWPSKQVMRLAGHLAGQVTEDVEFRADALAARVASTEAAIAALASISLSGPVQAQLRRVAVEARTFGRKDMAQALWNQLAAHADTAREGAHSSGEGSQARISALTEAVQHAATVVLDAETAEAVDRELQPAKRTVAGRYIQDLTGGAH
ncbi:M48 family metallopeptidase [Streptomyces sp. NPDC058739]|uniref:M48 family metallopeptidase n=1 Tax=Streptomyces sp. NPDC058739 TaxID=3346618 RepID=UPI0036A78A1F